MLLEGRIINLQMVRRENNLYVCEECNLAYETEKLAKKCEEFCSKYNACSVEITKKSVK